eukprot:COSAG06_NODE_16662_length_988_cov_0.975253_3_plen_115_part_00
MHRLLGSLERTDNERQRSITLDLTSVKIVGHKPLLTVAPVRTFDDQQRYVPGGDELHAEMKKHGYVLIASGCGTGKTTSIRGCLEKHMTCLPTEHGERSRSDGRILMVVWQAKT